MSTYGCNCFKVLLMLLGIACILPSTAASDGPLIERAVVDSVVQVVTPTSGKGTAFLIGIPLEETKDRREHVFLVTNKHMLGDWNPADGDFKSIHDWITVRLYKKRSESSGPVIDIRVRLKHPDGSLDKSQVALHTDPSVDVAVVELNGKIFHPQEFELVKPVQTLLRTYFISFNGLHDEFTGIGSLVLALGFPLGITSVLTNRPVAKAGYLAATPGEELALDTPWKTRDGKIASVTVRGKLLLIDGLIVPGNSGGPVVLPAGGRFGHDSASGKFQIRMSNSSRIIGVVSSILGPSGLSIAYSTDYVNELIESLLKTTSSKP
jgi:hypothetical protein